MKNSFLRMFIIFNIREVSYKGQFIESLPVISNTGQLQSMFALNITYQKLTEKCLSYEMNFI